MDELRFEANSSVKYNRLTIPGEVQISAQPVDAVRRGASAKVDLLIGTNSQEVNLYYVPTGVVDLIEGDEKVCQSMRNRHPEPEKLVATYRAAPRPLAQASCSQRS